MSVQSSPSKERDALTALSAFVERRSLVMLALGFSAGLPFLLIFDTLSAWLRVAGLSLEVIGFFSLTTLIYSFKFLWAPLIDRARVPLLTGWLGHRRSWMLLCQALIMLGLWLVAGSDPTSNLAAMAVFAVFVGFSSATQDVVIDAWRIEAAEISKQGVMAAAYQWGYRIAMIVAGAAPLLLAESYGWNFSYAVMAALMSIGMLAVLWCAARRAPCHPPDPARRRPRLASARDRRMAGAARDRGRRRGVARLRPRGRRARAVASPLRHRLGRARRWLGRHVAAALRRLAPASLGGGGFRRAADRRLAGSGHAHASRPLSRRGLGRSVARFLRALSRQRGPDPGADLHLPALRLRAQHHEPVLSRSRVHADRSGRGAEDLRRRRVRARRLSRRIRGGAFRPDARASRSVRSRAPSAISCSSGSRRKATACPRCSSPSASTMSAPASRERR